MKYGFVLILCCFSILVSCKKETDKNVYDYYQSLPEDVFESQDLGHLKYNLVSENNTWQTTSVSGQKFAPVVDIENGYIEINDEGTGGGNIYQQIVLFTKADSSPLIAITKGSFNGFYFDSSKAFYEKSGNTWVEASNVFPEISIQRFLGPKYRDFNFKNDDVITPNLTTITHLYQHHKKVEVEPNFNKFDFLIESNQNIINQKSFTAKEAEKLWEIIKNITVETIVLKFDNKTARFIVEDSVSLNQNKPNLTNLNEDDAEFSKDEQYMVDKLWSLNKVRDLAHYIDSTSEHTRSLKMVFERADDEKPEFQRIHAVEDNGGNYVTHFIFSVKNDGSEIYFYDAIKDEYVRINI